MISNAASTCRDYPSAVQRFRRSRQHVGVLVAGGLILGLASPALVGCGKKAQPEPAPPQVADESQVPAGRAPAPPVVQGPAQPHVLAVPEGANTDVVLQQLNRELIKWVVGHRRAPKTFEEFVSSAQLTVPPPPAGKRYVLGKDMKISIK